MEYAPPPTKSPSLGRRGRGSISGLSALTRSDDNGGSFASGWKKVKERMRSDSKSRAKSPPQGENPSPYETQLPLLGPQISPPVPYGDSQGLMNVERSVSGGLGLGPPSENSHGHGLGHGFAYNAPVGVGSVSGNGSVSAGPSGVSAQEMSVKGSPPRLGVMGYRNPMEIKRQIEGGMI
ncbi:MAG: hypothetical protein Q9162_005805 [Coniocarpon cinnabarinum]